MWREGCDLNIILKERVWKQENESVAIRNVFCDKGAIVLNDSIIWNHSAIPCEYTVGDRLLDKEIWKFNI